MAKQEGRLGAKNIDPPVTGSCRRASSLLKTSSCPATTSENGGDDGVETAKKVAPASASKTSTLLSRAAAASAAPVCSASGTLLVVATLITALSYQVGSNVPGGYWQDDAPGHHRAGEPIMRTQRFWLYTVFMWSSWIGFAASMGITLALLTGMPPRSRLVRGLLVLSYSTLILSFVTQQAFSIIWVNLLVWVAAVVFITCAINSSTHPYLRRFFDWLCREPVPQTS